MSSTTPEKQQNDPPGASTVIKQLPLQNIFKAYRETISGQAETPIVQTSKQPLIGWFWQQSTEEEISSSSNFNLAALTKQPLIQTDSDFYWPDRSNVKEIDRKSEHLTLDELIKKIKLRQKAQLQIDILDQVDFSGETISKSQIDLLMAQPSILQQQLETTNKLLRSKPLQLQVESTPEQIAEQQILRQKQIQEQEYLYDQVDFSGETFLDVNAVQRQSIPQETPSNISLSDNKIHFLSSLDPADSQP